ncbi:MAG TPA: zinc ribbon domain-containing protein [Solirubrobacteraceae bacterium]|nr:zinc ribbon domain-containing protein [Solirubrobacteraceae bacterium]
MEPTPATTVEPASGQAARADGPADGAAQPRPGFVARGRLRRRARFLRKARELAYRDLGGLVFSLHRFGQRNDALVLAKLSTLGQMDTELRALESALQEPQPITVLREAGITACARCAAIHSTEDRFCPNCGLPLSRRVDLPVAGAAAAPGSAPASRPGAPLVSAVRAWTSPAATPGAAPTASSPTAQARPGIDQATSARPPVPAQPERPAFPAPAERSEGTEVYRRPPAAGGAPSEGKTTGAPAAFDGRPSAESERPSAPDDDQPTEIMRPSGPAGP